MKMTIDTWLNKASQKLADASIATARLDVLVLLEDALGQDRAYLLAHADRELSNEQISILDEQIKRRARHIPLAYIRGRTEFYGRDFIVNDHVLEPRPESEMIIDLFKYLSHSDSMTVADIGTGSGALAVTIKLDLPGTTVYAVDIDANCLALTRRNAKRLNADVEVLEGNLLQPLLDGNRKVDTLVCNLPYVPDGFHINTAATHEPRLAIFGGPDGLDAYRELFHQIGQVAPSPRYILTESLPPQHAELAEIANSAGYRLIRHEDFIQVFSPRPVEE